MSPAFQYSEEISKPFHLNGESLFNGKRSSVQSNGSLLSDDSLSSSPKEHPNTLSVTGRSSKTDFLNKIKYFERRTDQEQPETHKPHMKTENADHHTFKKTIEEVRSSFLKEEYTHLSRSDSKVSNIRKDPPRNNIIRSPVPTPRRKFLEEQKESLTKRESFKKETIQLTPVIREKESNLKSKKPARELSIRETVNEVRSRFAEKNLADDKRTGNLSIDYLNSNCAKFFSTSDTKFLFEETTNDSKHFIIILKNILYDNAFYSLKAVNQRAHYYLHDFFEYDRLDMNMFDLWAL
ncbi:hypothetical protein ILUMI_26513 [Ignelater luminosus]|uniref:Uncharacterized protein n=1 Tax=Ignelater luminosus TaxID=2038154 RepID=A0A8K0C6K7_IGNLU|nr:hypothetical protein ILUMI_26513 [Ignelater luminosus]